MIMDYEPLFHSHASDVLSDDHPWAFKQVYCKDCEELVHAANNECMTTWMEYRGHAFCFPCFVGKHMEDEGELFFGFDPDEVSE